MTIIAIGSPEVLKRVQKMRRKDEDTSFRLKESMRTADETLATWEHIAAEMERAGYFNLRPSVFEAYKKYSPKNLTGLGQRVVTGSTKECCERFASKHCFEGENLDKSMRRIGAIYLLAQKVDRVHFVRFSFSAVLEGHGIAVPEYLQLKLELAAPKREEHRRPVEHERPRRSAEEMLKHAPMKANLAVRADGSVYMVKTKHKPIVPLTEEEKTAREKQRLAAKALKDAQRAAAQTKQAAKKKSSKGGGQQRKK